MSEENRRNAEINEAELTGVSGGGEFSPGISLRRGSAHMENVRAFCSGCPACDRPSRCTGGAEQLLEYVNQNYRTLHTAMDCPFFKH